MIDDIDLCSNNMHHHLVPLMQASNWQAFHDFNFSGLPGGVFTAACPPEAQHLIRNELINKPTFLLNFTSWQGDPMQKDATQQG